MIYGYCRVSSKTQLKNNSLQQQEEEITQKYPDAVIYKEQFTGSTTKRPVLASLLQQLKTDDTLVIIRLDRLVRSMKDGVELIQLLFDKGVRIHILNMGLVESSPMGRYYIHAMLAVAELEKDLLMERTQSGREVARQAEGYKEGRPKAYTRKQIAHALELLQDHSYKQVSEMTGISKSTLLREKKKMR